MSRAPIAKPPRLATWLVDLFVSDKRTEPITGDLLEEFSDLASRAGVASARKWYWRQSVKTAAHLIGAGFRVAPWLIIGAVLGGYLLLAFGAWLPEWAIEAFLDFHRNHVTPFYTWPQLQAYVFWLNNAILMGRLIYAMLIGCIVAMVAKAREIVATLTLALVHAAVSDVRLVLLARHWSVYGFGLPPLLLTIFQYPIMILAGGGIVRAFRSTAALRHPSA